MNKTKVEQQNRELKLRCERLARLLRSTQTRALDAIRGLEQALQVDSTCVEAASEQVTRCDLAIQQALARLARIVDPAAHAQDQADQMVQRFRELGPQLFDALQRYIARVFEESLPHDVAAGVPNSVEEAIAHAVDRIELSTSELDEEHGFSPLIEASDALRLAMVFVASGVMPEKERL